MTPLRNGAPESIGGYTLLGRLGAGGMGVVYLGVSASGRQVAVKLVHGPYAQEDEFRTHFRQEVAAARRVSGAFTAPVVDADPDAEQPWMATLYVPGRMLSDPVAKDGPLRGRELRVLALGLVEALRDIHRAGMDRASVGLDFAMVEGCAVWNECGGFAEAFGDDVLVVEYTAKGMAAACSGWGSTLSVVRRDEQIVPKGSSGYVHQ